MKKIVRTFTDHNGQRHYAYGDTIEEAILNRERLKRKIEEDRHDSTTLFRTWADTALKTYKPNVSPRYEKEIRCRLDKHINASIGHLPVSKVSPLMCQQILNGAKGKSRSHITKLSQELYFYFDMAVQNGLIQKNPADRLIRPTGYTHKRRALTTEEREHFEKVAEAFPRFVLFELMLYCGCRPAEAAEVRFSDVTEIDGVPFLHIRGTKTANSDRLVPIPVELWPKLLKSRKSAPVACTGQGNKHTQSSYKRLTERLCREMNISMGCKVYRNQLMPPFPLAEDFVPYLFRHTYCTDLKKKGVDIRIAKDLMGHADIKTTANIYDHADGDTLRLAAEQMGLLTNTNPHSTPH